MQEPLEIRLLGPFEVLAGGTPADVGGSKRQALLAMLALRQGRMVDVDALVDGLWGEELPAAPRNALHHHIARLRAALGEESIVGSPDGYALKDARVDAVRFEELLAETRAALRDGDVSAAADAVASALALWRGPALQGLTGTAWFSAEARRLEALRVDALEEHFEVALALGEHRELTPALRSALADNPFRERLWGQLMLALYRSGRQADALETFQEARRVLADELGLEPGPELRRLQEAILAHDPAIAAVPVDRRRRGNLPAPSTSFVGREEELGQVAALLRRAPPRDAHRAARRRQEPARGRDGALARARVPRRHLARRLRARGRRGRRRPAPCQRRRRSRLRPARARGVAAPDAGALVVLDACEHVLEEAARIASTLLAECPRVRILATSREALHVAGEARVPVAPLGSAAVDLFLERARAARPGFEPDAEAVALAAEIARRVDGLPLAIELAAARVNVLGLGELVSILERRAALLRDSPASDPGRTALQELVDWSYDLLHGDEKTLLQQLAVHRGGASLASLVAVAATHGLNEATVAYLVAALVDKSIVVGLVRGRRRPVRHARHRPRVRARASRRERRPRRRPRRPRRVLRGAGRGGARRAARAGMAAVATPTGAGERQPLGGARRTRGRRPTLPSRLGSGRWGGTSRWPSAFPRDGASSSSRSPPARRRAGRAADRAARRPLLPRDRRARSRRRARGGRARALARRGRAAPWQLGLAQLTLALALAQSGDDGTADAMAQEAAATFEAAGDDWGMRRAASSARSARRPPATSPPSPRWRRRSAVTRTRSTTTRSASRGCCSRRGWRSAGGTARPRWTPTGARSSSPGASGSATTRRSRSPGSARTRSRTATCARPRSSSGRRLPPPRRPRRRGSRPTHASSSARIAAAAGDADGAERLYRQVLEWSQLQRPHQARESLFVALAGSPADGGACSGSSEIAARHLSWQNRRRAWQSVGSGGPSLRAVKDRRTGGST